nr:unnamed protein product [Digitaria exilis]
MAAPNATAERFKDAIRTMTNIGFRKEIVVRVLKKLLTLYDDNWEHIEADNYTALADALCDIDDSDPKQEGQKKRTEKKNLDWDHCNKKLRIKEISQKPKPSIHGSSKREPGEVPRPQKAEAIEGKIIGTQLKKQGSQIVMKEPKKESSFADTTTIGESSSASVLKSQEFHTFETPLAVMCPSVLEPSCHNGYEDAPLISGVQRIDKKLKGVLVAREGQMANACNSQAIVFLTREKKGWGLRPAEKLPQGAFVCEYVGEILTNTELYERNNRLTGKEKHTYPVLLNADWGTDLVLKDEEALCLDGTLYGNVARFINHRCFDANIIDVPVEIETPDHHYYHIAFFTTREVDAFEELTWDYGIDFDDVNHPVKAFKCRCGSQFCRGKSRSSRKNAI